MPKVLICGRGGSGKSTLVTMLAKGLAEQGRDKVLVIDSDESNLGLGKMLDIQPPARTVMDSLGGKEAVGKSLMAALRSEGTEEVKMFSGDFTFGDIAADSVSWSGTVGLAQIGKVEHAHEGCACPMGALAREFLNKVRDKKKEWVIVDTEAGVEHFGRGVLEGVDTVLMVVDPSYEAVLLAEKAAKLAKEAEKPFSVILNKVNADTEAQLKEMLKEKGIEVTAVLPFSAQISRANLVGEPLQITESLRQILNELIGGIANANVH
ncbi:MAG: AAA family ATPase [Firmicutes bacterium]|nr:AAA family ATPase [Bacillota bacterium]